jgi:hypothetical protein
VTSIAKISPGHVHYCSGLVVYASRGQTILRSEDGGDAWEPICQLPVNRWSRVAGSTRLSRRLFRTGVYHILVTNCARLVIFAFGRVFRCEPNGENLQTTEQLVGSRPLVVSKIGADVMYGEYRKNKERSPVHIWRSSDAGETWTADIQLDSVRHVHGVHEDPYSPWFWVTTGDRNHESGLWRGDLKTRAIEPVLRGSQRFRIVQPIFTQQHVYFGSDTQTEPNFIYRWDRETEEVTELQQVDGPVFFGRIDGGRFYFSTVCEPMYDGGSGFAVVWQSKDGMHWKRLLEYPKDGWPMTLFQFGQVQFASGPGEDGFLWLTPYATRGEQRSVKIAV